MTGTFSLSYWIRSRTASSNCGTLGTGVGVGVGRISTTATGVGVGVLFGTTTTFFAAGVAVGVGVACSGYQRPVSPFSSNSCNEPSRNNLPCRYGASSLTRLLMTEGKRSEK
ncbi:MAG TPA: hypothetical protein DCY86_16600 [Bdellovibrionales bacterium]|nr:hypothetical protein [Bdellovibrionales bacterium]